MENYFRLCDCRCHSFIYDTSSFFVGQLLLPTLGLLQGWLDVGAMGILSLLCFCFGWTNIAELLFVNLCFYIFIQQRFQAGQAMNSSPAASPARYKAV
jgi:hypothetical protein